MAFSIFGRFPDAREFLNRVAQYASLAPVPSNLHIHTPYSFSAFTNISEAVNLAREQGVRVLGINDFNTTQGYSDFTEECQKTGVFPIYCMETITLSIEDRELKKRWNDPVNPGRLYFSGKGLRHPVQSSQHARDTLIRIARALEERTRKMTDKMNRHLRDTLPNIRLDYDHIRDTITKGTVRERHVAKALQQAIDREFPDTARKADALKLLYSAESRVDVSDEAALQNELRSNLLKAGKPAFVEERREAYLSFDGARSLILDMGGIPCYPMLIAGAKDEFTEGERDPERLGDELLQRGVYCAEFISTRNDIDLLKGYVAAFKKRGIILNVGTEHNTPRMEPMAPRCYGGVELDDALKEAFWKGACVVAAHQYLTAVGRPGYVEHAGQRTGEEIKQLETIGEAVIAYYLSIFDF